MSAKKGQYISKRWRSISDFDLFSAKLHYNCSSSRLLVVIPPENQRLLSVAASFRKAVETLTKLLNRKGPLEMREKVGSA